MTNRAGMTGLVLVAAILSACQPVAIRDPFRPEAFGRTKDICVIDETDTRRAFSPPDAFLVVDLLKAGLISKGYSISPVCSDDQIQARVNVITFASRDEPGRVGAFGMGHFYLDMINEVEVDIVFTDRDGLISHGHLRDFSDDPIKVELARKLINAYLKNIPDAPGSGTQGHR